MHAHIQTSIMIGLEAENVFFGLFYYTQCDVIRSYSSVDKGNLKCMTNLII